MPTSGPKKRSPSELTGGCHTICIKLTKLST
jgi:hypothetical protein